MTIFDRPTTFGVTVGTRGFFSPQLAREGRRALLARMERLGLRAVILDEGAPGANAASGGLVETRSDALRCAALFQAQRERIDGVVVSLPNFGDETGIVRALDQAKLDVPVLVRAFDDDPEKVDVAHRRDAFCGKISVCANLSQYGIPWTDTTEHTCATVVHEATTRYLGWDIHFHGAPRVS